MGTFKSHHTGKNYREHQKVGAHQVQPEILQSLKEENPQFTADRTGERSYFCNSSWQ